MTDNEKAIANPTNIPGAGIQQEVLVGTGGWTEKRFVGLNSNGAYIISPTADLYTVGVSNETQLGGKLAPIDSSRIVMVEAAEVLAARDPLKVGNGGRATKHSSTISLDTAFTGDATSVTQPGAATLLQIFQAANVAGDQGRVVRVVGGDAAGDVIYEDFTLDASDTSTIVAGTTSFTTVCGAYMLDGLVSGAQDITIEESDTTDVCVLVGASLDIGFDLHGSAPVTTYDMLLTSVGPNADSTYVTYFGTLEDGSIGGERVVYDGASPSAAPSTLRFKNYIGTGTGEATNAGSFLTVTAIADAEATKVGFNTAAVAAENDLCTMVFEPGQ